MRKIATPAETTQTMQRVRVGVTGLALVLLLIGLASAIFSSVNRERPVAAIGGARPETVAAIADQNAIDPADPANEPLADLGVAPAAVTDENLVAGAKQ